MDWEPFQVVPCFVPTYSWRLGAAQPCTGFWVDEFVGWLEGWTLDSEKDGYFLVIFWLLGWIWV